MECVAIRNHAHLLSTAERNTCHEGRELPPSMLRLLGAKGARVASLANILCSTVSDVVPFRVIGLTSECGDDSVFGINNGARGSEGYKLISEFNRWVDYLPSVPLDVT